jgi:hypothetical protein
MPWQDILALSLVAAAALYLCFRGWQTFVRKKRSACGGCAGCSPPGKDGSPRPPIVTLQTLQRSAKRKQE